MTTASILAALPEVSAGTAGKPVPAHPGSAFDHAHAFLNGLFSLLMPDAQACERLGLRAVSNDRDGNPIWYVWLAQRSGAFGLTLLNDRPVAGHEGIALEVRYFPDPAEAIFPGFALCERQARQSALFDASGTPAAHAEAQLGPGLFHVGVMVIRPRARGRVVFSLNSQDRWVEEFRHGGVWQVRRDVPGLELAVALFDAIACALAYLGRQAPDLARTWSRPGYVWKIADSGRAIRRHDDRMRDWTVELHGLLAPGRQDARPSSARRDLRSRLPAFEHSGEFAPHAAPWPVNPLWWLAAGWQFEAVGSFCTQCAAEDGMASRPRRRYLFSRPLPLHAFEAMIEGR